MIYILFLIGFVILIKGADVLVDGSSNLASKFGISEIIIGLTIVSIGTSFPELIVNILASIDGNTDLAIGNVLGSNIANILLILGCTALIYSVPVQRNTVLSEIPYSIAAILLIGFLANANVWRFGDDTVLGLSRVDGALIMLFFLIFFAYIFLQAKQDKQLTEDVAFDHNTPLWKDFLFIVLGIVMLYFGGRWVVDGAVHLAQQLGLSQTFISLTLVAIGTSLPELVTSIRSAMKGSTDLAMGNVVGSNIFNALWILGLSSTIKEMPFNKAANEDLLIVLLATLLVIVLMIMSRKMIIKRWHGAVLLIAYVSYNIYIFFRDQQI